MESHPVVVCTSIESSRELASKLAHTISDRQSVHSYRSKSFSKWTTCTHLPVLEVDLTNYHLSLHPYQILADPDARCTKEKTAVQSNRM